MKSRSFADVQAEKAHLRRQGKLLLPGGHIAENWPLCMTCGRMVDAAELKDVNAFGCVIYAKHHGAEDYYKVTFPFRIEGDPLTDERANAVIQRAMRDGQFFDPTIPKK
jgi:hypothetical protein